MGRRDGCITLIPAMRSRVVSTTECPVCKAVRHEPCYNTSKGRRRTPIKHLHVLRVDAYNEKQGHLTKS